VCARAQTGQSDIMNFLLSGLCVSSPCVRYSSLVVVVTARAPCSCAVVPREANLTV